MTVTLYGHADYSGLSLSARASWSETDWASPNRLITEVDYQGTFTSHQADKVSSASQYVGSFFWVTPAIQTDRTMGSGSVTFSMTGDESAALLNAYPRMFVWVCNSSGTYQRDFVTTTAIGSTEFSTAYAVRTVTCTTVNGVTIYAGERLVFECGYSASTSRTGNVLFAMIDASSDVMYVSLPSPIVAGDFTAAESGFLIPNKIWG